MNTVNFVLVLISLVLACVLYSTYQYYRPIERDLAWYKDQHRVQQGWSSGFGNFYLVSLDGGLNWYSAERDGEEVRIIGQADQKLLDHMDGLHALTDYVRNNGPIGSRPITDVDTRVLERAGFEVKGE
jgi:hypothetical protein